MLTDTQKRALTNHLRMRHGPTQDERRLQLTALCPERLHESPLQEGVLHAARERLWSLLCESGRVVDGGAQGPFLDERPVVK